MTFWARADKFPPILVRLLAGRKRPMTDTQIAQRSGLPIAQVFHISQSVNWSGIDLPTMRSFLTACDVDFENPTQMHRIDIYLRRATWQCLRKSPHWKTYFEPLMRRYIDSRKAE